MLLLLLNLVLYVEVMSNEEAMVPLFDINNDADDDNKWCCCCCCCCWWCFCSLASVTAYNRFCNVVCDVIDVGLSVEVWILSPNNSLSFGWVETISLSSNDSVGLTINSVCVLGRSLASGKSIFNELFFVHHRLNAYHLGLASKRNFFLSSLAFFLSLFSFSWKEGEGKWEKKSFMREIFFFHIFFYSSLTN